ncbi:MAG: hypothetical protein JNM14_05810 [Ferruginibacter sp.]|nr:hypothetical protein [Ferruginibacter sp.]
MIWILNFFEITACITGFVYYKKLKGGYWKWFPFYLLIIVLVEFTGRYLSDSGLISYNIAMYKFFGMPVQFLFFYFIFYQHEYFRDKRKWILTGAAVYVTSIVFETVFLTNKSYWFHSFSYSIGNVILLILLIAFFIKFIQSDAILDFSKNLMFWFCLGLLLYYLGSFPFWALRNVLVAKYRNALENYYIVMLLLNYCMYLSFITGFILCRKK